MKNNKDKCKIIINEKEFRLIFHITINNKQLINVVFYFKKYPHLI